jgi:hypothetical protein
MMCLTIFITSSVAEDDDDICNNDRHFLCRVDYYFMHNIRSWDHGGLLRSGWPERGPSVLFEVQQPFHLKFPLTLILTLTWETSWFVVGLLRALLVDCNVDNASTIIAAFHCIKPGGVIAGLLFLDVCCCLGGESVWTRPSERYH